MFEVTVHYFMLDTVCVNTDTPLAFITSLDMRKVSHFQVVCNMA